MKKKEDEISHEEENLELMNEVSGASKHNDNSCERVYESNRKMKQKEDEFSHEEENLELMNEGIKPSTFEDAINATGFGKFNIVLLCIIIPGSFAQISEQTSLAYVIPIAQCDLNLSLEDKGVVVSISYAGMIASSFLWGYICDTYGRRKLIIYGFMSNAFCHILVACSQNFQMLLIAKFISGFMFTGPFSAITSYLSEFHSTANRSRVQLIRGTASGVAVVVIPMMAWVILPQTFEIIIAENIRLHAWNFFVAMCALPAFITATTFIFMPESPKFLMSSGKNTEALGVFRRVYKTNTGRRCSSYPIEILESGKSQTSQHANGTYVEERSAKGSMMRGLLAVKPLFQLPYSVKLAHACFNSMLLLIGTFAIKLWYPQILQAINDVKEGENKLNICTIVSSLARSNTSSSTACSVNLDNSSVYINASILGAVQIVAFILAGFAVNKTGKKPLVGILSTAAAICPILLYFISNGTVMLMLLPPIIAFAEIGGNVLLTISMEMFPTSFRTTALTFHMMVCRIGVVIGNLLLPYLLKTGCLPTLSFISLSVVACVGLTSLLPNTDNKDLE